MFFSNALSALQKHQDDQEDEEEDVFQQGKWNTLAFELSTNVSAFCYL